uniref:cytochrome c oxidase subunit II n=1 Tax=Bipalium admarginatum TaxID=3023024 RepID=UPI002410FA2B|nr:cytochrome c oxidase subunit II [Bipalium admarginatum]WEM34733.1 cytochrome c oxidase subunit 2 [Bipalium admarginatum]
MSFGMLNSHSPVGKFLDLFHDWSLFILVVISCFVLSIIIVFGLNSFRFNDCTESKLLELIWTVIPGFVLLLVVVPSFYGLYLLDLNSLIFPFNSIKIGGRQWYWSYSYTLPSISSSEDLSIKYDSYINQNNLEDVIRSLDVDLPLVIISKLVSRLLLSSSDVIHSFAVPQLGFKLDCVPGRLNSSFVVSNHIGKFYGQCSEICGVNHSFMPISVECFPQNYFFSLH